MARIRPKTIRELNEADLRGKISEARAHLAKLRVDGAKGTLRKESGKLRPLRRDIARMLTRLNEVKK
ncbi:MAG: 50S ribosomal protein L29 [Nitrosopumilus sp. H8]|nr:MAG: 50S ribosomal protein L29 [Nitrosopumilus sp. H13]RNJ78719.1 MAG: 50S ribosomal protein L29 [Nitrosopumilus sp. H8]